MFSCQIILKYGKIVSSYMRGGTIFMFPEEIVEIIQKYQNQVSEEISNINLSVDKIKDELDSISMILMNEVISYSKNGSKNSKVELELHSDSIKLREFIDSINKIPHKKIHHNIKELGIHDVIVLSSVMKCSSSGHKMHDITVFVPILHSSGDVTYVSVLASYCYDCNQYTMLKDTFQQLDGVILCQVIDKTKSYEKQDLEEDDFDIEQKQSLLYKYGYNVKTQANISRKQRQIILASVIESGIMTRTQVIDHLSTLISRGDKIKSWRFATQKWKEDKYYVQNYSAKNLPNIITNKIILKYNYEK